MLARQTLITLLLAGQAGYTSAYNNGAPGSKLPVLGWSSCKAHPIAAPTHSSVARLWW